MTAVGANHLAKLEQGEDEDYVEYLCRQGDEWINNPPPAPPGFELIPCHHQPRHWPLYTVVDDDFYGTDCQQDFGPRMADEVDRLKHRLHSPWASLKVTGWLIRHATLLGLINGSVWQGNRYCRGCYTSIRFRGKRRYILGVSREAWHCLLVGHHIRGEHVGFGFCGKCLPCPDCGSTTGGHRGGCEGRERTRREEASTA